VRVLSIIEADYISGAAKNLLEFARHNRNRQTGTEHALAAYQRGDSAESPLIRAIRDTGVPLFVIPESGRFDFSVARRLRNAADEWGADIVETNNVKSHFFLRASGLWRERKWIAHHHGFTAEDLKMKLYNQTTRWSLRAAHRVVTVCGPFAELLASHGVDRRRIVVKHNSVEPFVPPAAAEMEQARGLIGAPTGSQLLVAIGRLSPEKGHADLVEAVAQLVRENSRVHLVIVGNGPEQDRLQQQCVRLGIAQQVTFAGIQADVRAFYALADVLVLPSHSEGSPHVLLEAMSAGCAIVATRVGGIPEMVRNGENALLVDSAAPAKLADGINTVLADTNLRHQLGESARDRALKDFSPEEHWHQWNAIYREVLMAEDNKFNRDP
jgi:glycosyltransferase involved in cell wall biosynthesis